MKSFNEYTILKEQQFIWVSILSERFFRCILACHILMNCKMTKAYFFRVDQHFLLSNLTRPENRSRKRMPPRLAITTCLLRNKNTSSLNEYLIHYCFHTISLSFQRWSCDNFVNINLPLQKCLQDSCFFQQSIL